MRFRVPILIAHFLLGVSANFITKAEHGVGHFAQGAGHGLHRIGEGLVDTVRHPVKAVEGAATLVRHPVQSARGFARTISEVKKEHGLAYAIGEGAAQVGAMALPIAAEAAVGARVAGIADGVSHLTDAKELGEQREKGIKRKDDKENKADVRTNVYHFPDENLQPSRKSKRLASEAFDDYHSPRYHQNSDYALFGGYQLADSYRSHKQPKYSDPLEDVGDHLTDNEIRKITEESDEDPDSLLLNNPFDSADENETDDDEGDFDYHDPLAL